MTSALRIGADSYRCDLPCHGSILDCLYGLVGSAVIKGERHHGSSRWIAGEALEFGDATDARGAVRVASRRRDFCATGSQLLNGAAPRKSRRGTCSSG